jgi:hypothetical protein
VKPALGLRLSATWSRFVKYKEFLNSAVMIASVIVCCGSLAVVVWWLRRKQASLGIPIAYLSALLFIHVPGAIAHIVGGEYLLDTEATEIGIRYTAIGAAAFMVGVIVVVSNSGSWECKKPIQLANPGLLRFAFFCLWTGLLVTYTLRVIVRIPSIGAIIEKGGGIWVLGVLLGLQSALSRGSPRQTALWVASMGVYPSLTLLFGGFLSFASIPVFIILSTLTISTRSSWRVAIGLPVVALVFFTFFLSYFQSRDRIRDAVWGGGTLNSRISESSLIFTGLEIFDPQKQSHLNALDLRLNQNYFVGRAEQRIRSNEVDLKYGHTLWEALISLVPRLIWPSKPVMAGSPAIIMEMTGFIVAEGTSYGIGNVMEFYINYGLPSLISGFLCLGILLGWLDRQASLRVQRGDWGGAVVYFMPAAAMIHPNGSLVELFSGGAAAFFAALLWRAIWRNYFPSSDPVDLKRRKRIISVSEGA